MRGFLARSLEDSGSNHGPTAVGFFRKGVEQFAIGIEMPHDECFVNVLREIAQRVGGGNNPESRQLLGVLENEVGQLWAGEESRIDLVAFAGDHFDLNGSTDGLIAFFEEFGV